MNSFKPNTYERIYMEDRFAEALQPFPGTWREVSAGHPSIAALELRGQHRALCRGARLPRLRRRAFSSFFDKFIDTYHKLQNLVV